MPETLQSIDGRLEPVIEICMEHALKTLIERRSQDTKPVIVRMVLRGDLIDHWYYMSEQWIDQPYFIPHINLQPYVGPAREAPVEFYGIGTYLVEDRTNQLIAGIPNEHIRFLMRVIGIPFH